MQLNNISRLIEIQEAKVVGIGCGIADEIHIYVEAETYEQSCPCCKSTRTNRNGKDGYRKVRHLPIAGKKCLLIAPKTRLKCKSCGATYAYEYAFVSGKQRHTKAYKVHLYGWQSVQQ